MLLIRLLVLMLIAAAWSGSAQAQPAQVEAVPAFDMFDLDSLDDDAIALPSETLPAAAGEPLDSLDVAAPQGVDTNDPCRHFSEEQRRRLPLLCGPGD